MLSLHLENSTMFFQQGSYRQAMQQANMALEMDGSQVGMRIIKGFCLTKLGAAQGTVAEVDAAIDVFDELKASDGADDYRTWLGSGEAHMTRALRHNQALARIQRRLDSDFLTDEGRESEGQAAREEHLAEMEQLAQAESDLRRVLAFPLHHDSTYALLDLIVAVNMAGNRGEEAAALCRRTIKLLVEGTELTRETLNNGIRLSPSKKVDLQQRVDDSLDKERQLRQILINIEFDRGSYQRCLEDLAALEERQLMSAADHQLRAEIYQRLKMLPDAIDEYDVFLRLRSQHTGYDDVASQTLQRIADLQAKIAAGL